MFNLPPQLLDCSMIFLSSKLQVEADEKLQTIYQQLLQAGVERQESEKESKMKETIANLQRIFPGT
jgi:structural maintenance of chromosome 1